MLRRSWLSSLCRNYSTYCIAQLYATPYTLCYTRIVPSVLVQLDDATYKALNQIAPAATRQRTEFMRRAVKEALRRREYARMREAYRKHPDSAAEADDWAACEKFDA